MAEAAGRPSVLAEVLEMMLGSRGHEHEIAGLEGKFRNLAVQQPHRRIAAEEQVIRKVPLERIPARATDQDVVSFAAVDEIIAARAEIGRGDERQSGTGASERRAADHRRGRNAWVGAGAAEVPDRRPRNLAFG